MQRALLNIAYGAKAQTELDITRENHKEYARQCGAEYIELLSDTELGYGPSAKFKAVGVAANFDQTLLLDTDTIVMKPHINIFETCPVGWWGFVDELRLIEWPLDEFKSTLIEIADLLYQPHVLPTIDINSGVMLLPRDASIYLPPAKPLPVTWCIEQIWLTYRMLSTDTKYVRIDPRFNWCKWFKSFEQGRKDAIILHWNDRNNRIDILKQLIAAVK